MKTENKQTTKKASDKLGKPFIDSIKAMFK
jgi:hypothetical protein